MSLSHGLPCFLSSRISRRDAIRDGFVLLQIAVWKKKFCITDLKQSVRPCFKLIRYEAENINGINIFKSIYMRLLVASAYRISCYNWCESTCLYLSVKDYKRRQKERGKEGRSKVSRSTKK
jgi:hypothetical protein